VFGYPIKWKKVGGGLKHDWIGYWLDWARFERGISAKRAMWLIRWVIDTLKSGRVRVTTFRSVLGRFGFAVQVLELDRPFLGPLHAWVSRLPEEAIINIPLMVRLVLSWLKGRLLKCHIRPVRPPSMFWDRGEWFRGDASATDTDIRIGAWMCADGVSSKEAPFFSMAITRDQAPWDFAREDNPQRVVASLELLTTTIAVMVFDTPSIPTKGTFVVSAGTDNEGNYHIVRKLMTTKYHICCVLMELSAQLAKNNMIMHLAWRRRDRNVEADDLSNNIFDKFDVDKRINVKFDDLKWEVLETMMKTGQSLYEDLKNQREAAKSFPEQNSPKRRRVRASKLRFEAPWNEEYKKTSLKVYIYSKYIYK